MKTLPQDVANLVFVHQKSRFSFLVNPASTARSSGHKHALCRREERLLPSLCLMLLAGLQDVGHEDVATGCGDFSLRSLNEPFQLFSVIQLRLLGARVISKYSAGEEPSLRVFVFCLSQAYRMWVMKTLPQDVANLVFVP